MSKFKQAAATIGAGVLAATMATASSADGINQRDIGEVDTAWNLFGNHSIRVIAFEDPEIQGITCHLSRPITGGISGSLGFAENKSDASIACRQSGPIVVTGDVNRTQDGEEVFNERRSVFFKELHVQRFFDDAANTFVYLTYSDKLIDGSPKNSLSTVVAMPWPENGQFVEPDFGFE